MKASVICKCYILILNTTSVYECINIKLFVDVFYKNIYQNISIYAFKNIPLMLDFVRNIHVIEFLLSVKNRRTFYDTF